mgnify:CR=1 FL=1
MGDDLKPTKPGDVLILLYHGVFPDGLDLQGRNSSGKHLPLSEFQRQMEIVKEKWAPVSMLDIDSVYRRGKELPERAIAITFDDGYRNVYTTAWPILRDMKIPFTLYLTTGWLGTGEMSWVDKLEGMLLPEHPRTFAILRKVMKRLEFKEIALALRDVESWIGRKFIPSPLYEMLSWEDVKIMAQSPFVTIGAHTVDHAPLARVSIEEMKRQVRDSIGCIYQLYKKNPEVVPPLFSYPEGQEEDFNEDSVFYLRNYGVEVCPTAIPGLNNVVTTLPMRLYRCAPGLGGQPFPLD